MSTDFYSDGNVSRFFIMATTKYLIFCGTNVLYTFGV